MCAARRFFETFSFLPPLDDAAIAKQVDYIIRQGWIPALEFAEAELAYVKNDSTIRFGGSAPCGYYDNRWKIDAHTSEEHCTVVTVCLHPGSELSILRASSATTLASITGSRIPSGCRALAS